MVIVNPSSVNNLVALKNSGAPVTLTSHPGNASLYKMSLWKCGIPEHLWDITCCKADANNWPMHRLVGGNAELLVSPEVHAKVISQTTPENRFVTSYQFTEAGERLGRFHVKAMQKCFPGAISSTSRLLLTEKEKVFDMFDYLARTRKEEVFSRSITSDGILRKTLTGEVPVGSVANSFIEVLEELDNLLFSDTPTTTKGGICYDGVIVQLSCMLVQYWQTGRIDRYDISGPDMIHYSTKPEYQKAMTEMLNHLKKWNASLIPDNIIVQMFPGTLARVGHISGHFSEEVMSRKIHMLLHGNSMDRAQKEAFWNSSKSDEKLWPMKIRPNIDHYFSQHDLLETKGVFEVAEFWRNIPFSNLQETIQRANGLLRL